MSKVILLLSGIIGLSMKAYSSNGSIDLEPKSKASCKVQFVTKFRSAEMVIQANNPSIKNTFKSLKVDDRSGHVRQALALQLIVQNREEGQVGNIPISKDVFNLIRNATKDAVEYYGELFSLDQLGIMRENYGPSYEYAWFLFVKLEKMKKSKDGLFLTENDLKELVSYLVPQKTPAFRSLSPLIRVVYEDEKIDGEGSSSISKVVRLCSDSSDLISFSLCPFNANSTEARLYRHTRVNDECKSLEVSHSFRK